MECKTNENENENERMSQLGEGGFHLWVRNVK